MSLGHGASIVREGLVLHYDTANPKSYNPNLLEYSQTFTNGYWTVIGVTFDSTTELAPDGTFTATTMRDDNAAGYEYISRDVAIPNDNQTYTFSYYLKKVNSTIDTALNARLIGGTEVNIFSRVAADGTGNGLYTLIDEGDWWRVYVNLTNNTSGNTTLRYQFFPAARDAGGDDGTVTGTNTVWGFMVNKGSTPLDYVPNNGKSSSIIYDLSGNNANATLGSNVSFSSNNKGVFSYQSTGTNTISTSAQNISSSQITAMTWVKVDGHGNFHNFVNNNWTNSGWLIYTTTTQWAAGIAQSTSQCTAGFNHNNSTDWTHLTLVYDAVNVLLYVNGELKATNSTAPGATLDTGFFIIFGGGTRPSAYQIANTMIYNRGLTATEVRQNFEVLRGRFGI